MSATRVISKEHCRLLYKLPEHHALPHYKSTVRFVKGVMDPSGYDCKKWVEDVR
jgi:hypothetical protein